MITIDAGNEVVAVFCLFLICLGLASLMVWVLMLIVHARAYERERRRAAAIREIGLDGVIE